MATNDKKLSNLVSRQLPEFVQSQSPALLEFVEKYLNEASHENMLYEAAVPKDKREMLKEEVKHDGVDYFTGNLVFEEGDEDIIPLDWAWKIK